jgi:hypothetical protein
MLPTLANAAAIPFFGPIIPQEGNQAVCAAGWGMLIVVINNIIAFSITIAIVFVAPIMIAYAGFLFVVNPVNASGKETAKKVLLNTIVGIVIALAGWMIVDALMVVLYNPSARSGTTTLGAWSQLITSGGLGPCIDLRGSVAPAVAPPPAVGVVPTVTVSISSGAVVSENAVNILKNILRVANLTSATITSGRRTSDDQTRVMYNNLQAANGVAIQRALYGPNGRAVIDVYVAQKQSGASEIAIKAAMKQKIEQLGCYNVSNHCSTSDVFDVAPSSIGNEGAFRAAVQNSSAVKRERFFSPPTDPAYHIELL